MSTQALDGLRRPGWLTFAAVILVSVGFLRIISAIYYFADSSSVNNLSGEDALRRLVEMPRRIVVQAVDDVDERLHDLAAKVRELDPLHGRVASIEKRLDALEKTRKSTGRRASTHARRSSERRPNAPPA